jgi:hypothetical protein
VESGNGPQGLAGLTPWKGGCDILSSGIDPQSCFDVYLANHAKDKYLFDASWMLDGCDTIPLSYLWGAPTGSGLPGSLGQGFAGVITPGTPTLQAILTAYPNLAKGGAFGLVDETPTLNDLKVHYDFAGNYLYPTPPVVSAPKLPPNLPSIWQKALSDISDRPGMTRKSIAARMLKLAPRSIWFDPSLYTMYATDNNHQSWTVIYNLDILNALATILCMSAVGAHPRAITTELLVQQANIYENGGPNTGVQNLSAAYRRFMDEWLNISQGFPPDRHVAVLGQMSSDAPADAIAKHQTTLSTLAQWVDHYLR